MNPMMAYGVLLFIGGVICKLTQNSRHIDYLHTELAYMRGQEYRELQHSEYAQTQTEESQ